MVNTRKLVIISLLVTMGTALHALEIIIPNPLPLPGAKLGLANIVTLVALFIYGPKEALSISVLRVLFGSLLTGTLFSVGFFLSLTGALFSLTVMSLLVRIFPVLSVIGVSIAGAAAHNTGQILVAAWLLETKYIVYYLPFLLLTGIPTGFFTGSVTAYLKKYLAGYAFGGQK